MLLKFFKDAIAMRITNNLVKISLAAQPFPRTTSIKAYALIVDNAGVLTTVKFALQMEGSVIIVALPEILQRNVKSQKKSQTQTRNKSQTDDVSFIYSGGSCISTSSNVARALKIRISKYSPKRIRKQNRHEIDITF